jgi:hypothetical protein
MRPTEAEAVLREKVVEIHPVLIPAWLPAGMEAQVALAYGGYNVVYRSDQRDKRISLSASPTNLANYGSGEPVKFRGVSAMYHVDDSGSALSPRWLTWYEPGLYIGYASELSWGKFPGIPYFLSTDGMTDQEFWQVANSLKQTIPPDSSRASRAR